MERSVSLMGTILIIGRDSAHVSIFPEPLQTKRARLILAKGNAGHGTYPHVLRLMASGRIDPIPMITAKYPFAELKTALDVSRARGHGKILVNVD
jgi:scyllo-inosose 3-dehydrogenase